MNARLMKLIHGSDSRYLTSEEQQEILGYTNSLPRRFQAAALVEQKERVAVAYCITEMRKRYPRFDGCHDQAWGKALRDVQLTVRYAVQAMIFDDVQLLDEKLLFWLRTILASFNFTPQFNRDTYTLLREGFRKELPADAFTLLDPCLQRMIEVLSDFPEPATPAV